MKNNKKILIAPSILSADFSDLRQEINAVESGGADWLHIDVMDGEFVPNITIGPVVIKSLRPVSDLVFDVHLMIKEPGRYMDQFAKAGSDYITIHVEAENDVELTIKKIKANGKKAGISVKPGTDISEINGFLDMVDMVLIMTVEPGFGGQKFMGDMIRKISDLRPRFEGLIQVDGGITRDNAHEVIEAGADVLVAGSAVFGSDDYAAEIKAIRGEI